MIEDNDSEFRQFRSCCPSCGKLLTKPTIKIERLSLTKKDFLILMKQVSITYGAESKCRRCRVVHKNLIQVA